MASLKKVKNIRQYVFSGRTTQLEIAGQSILLISESQTRIQDRSTNVYTQINLVDGATDQILSYTYLFLM